MKNKIILRGKEVTVIHGKDKVKEYKGDETLIQLIKPYFEKPLETITGSSKKIKNAVIYTSEAVTLKPGDESYVDAVLLDVLQNKMGMTIE